jgi:hypothetical protein
MIGVQPTMDVAKQARKFEGRMAIAASVEEKCYLAYLRGRMLATVAMGAPQPASNFLGMHEEEFSDE